MHWNPQMFSFLFSCLGRLVLGRDRSNGGSDGLTSLKLDVFDFIFLRCSHVFT